MSTTEPIRSPPACELCSTELPGPDPLRRPIHPEEVRKFTGDHQPRRPVRVSRPDPETGEMVTLSMWCSSRCSKKAKARPEKTVKGKPTRDQHFHINPRAA